MLLPLHNKSMFRSACWSGLTGALTAVLFGVPICFVGLPQLADLFGLSAREPEDAIKSIAVILLMFAAVGFLIGAGWRLWKEKTIAQRKS
jgi:hypothetical protein